VLVPTRLPVLTRHGSQLSRFCGTERRASPHLTIQRCPCVSASCMSEAAVVAGVVRMLCAEVPHVGWRCQVSRRLRGCAVKVLGGGLDCLTAPCIMDPEVYCVVRVCRPWCTTSWVTSTHHLVGYHRGHIEQPTGWISSYPLEVASSRRLPELARLISPSIELTKAAATRR